MTCIGIMVQILGIYQIRHEWALNKKYLNTIQKYVYEILTVIHGNTKLKLMVLQVLPCLLFKNVAKLNIIQNIDYVNHTSGNTRFYAHPSIKSSITI